MSESGFIDFSSEELDQRGDRPERPGRRGPRALTVFVLVVVVGLPLLAGWAHLRRVHEADLVAYGKLEEHMRVVDRDALPLLHGEYRPCGDATDAGVIERSYSPRTGPSITDLEDLLLRDGWDPVEPVEPVEPDGSSAPVLLAFERWAGDHRLVLVVEAPSQGRAGLWLEATSEASSWACLVAGGRT